MFRGLVRRMLLKKRGQPLIVSCNVFQLTGLFAKLTDAYPCFCTIAAAKGNKTGLVFEWDPFRHVRHCFDFVFGRFGLVLLIFCGIFYRKFGLFQLFCYFDPKPHFFIQHRLTITPDVYCCKGARFLSVLGPRRWCPVVPFLSIIFLYRPLTDLNNFFCL